MKTSRRFIFRRRATVNSPVFLSFSLTTGYQHVYTKKARSLVTAGLSFEMEIRSESLVDVAFADPVGVEFFAAGFVGSLVGVSAEVVSLSLQQVGGKTRSTVTVEVSQSRTEGGNRQAELDGRGNDSTP